MSRLSKKDIKSLSKFCAFGWHAVGSEYLSNDPDKAQKIFKNVAGEVVFKEPSDNVEMGNVENK